MVHCLTQRLGITRWNGETVVTILQEAVACSHLRRAAQGEASRSGLVYGDTPVFMVAGKDEDRRLRQHLGHPLRLDEPKRGDGSPALDLVIKRTCPSYQERPGVLVAFDVHRMSVNQV
jgi:hypothetical protein